MKIEHQPLTLRFAIATCILIIFTGVVSQAFFTRQLRLELERRLQEKATFINSFYSYLIADALVRKDDVTLLQIVNRLEQDEEISSVIVVDRNNELRYHSDPQKVGLASDDPVIKQTLQTGQALMLNYQNAGGKALGIVSPLKGAQGAIGAARINLTFRRIDNQVEKPRSRYAFVVFGLLVSCVGVMFTYTGRWVVSPLERLRNTFNGLNVAVPETNLPETPDDFGQMYAAANSLILRFKNELQQQWNSQQARAEQEKAWIQRLAVSFLPNSRVIIADKDNRIISDTQDPAPSTTRQQTHLLDLIKDVHFANLLTSAFEKEGEVVRGPVTFQTAAYEASILSVPLQQAAAVKTLIALQPK